jgi:hypothetical protein
VELPSLDHRSNDDYHHIPTLWPHDARNWIKWPTIFTYVGPPVFHGLAMTAFALDWYRYSAVRKRKFKVVALCFAGATLVSNVLYCIFPWISESLYISNVCDFYILSSKCTNKICSISLMFEGIWLPRVHSPFCLVPHSNMETAGKRHSMESKNSLTIDTLLLRCPRIRSLRSCRTISWRSIHLSDRDMISVFCIKSRLDQSL